MNVLHTARFAWLLLILLIMGCAPETETRLVMEARYMEKSGDSDAWIARSSTQDWQPQNTAILITDMWDQHWCEGATKRVAEMAPRMNQVVKAAREMGVLVVHAPSSVTDFYDELPARRRVWDIPEATPPVEIKDWYHLDEEKEPPLPIDDSDEGCDTCPGGLPCENVHENVWTRQIETIEIADQDAISDNGLEIYSLLQHHGIENIMMMGVHTNMCILGRPFGIRAQTALGMNVVLVRDLTDAMYNPEMPPYVTHDEGTQLVIEHIEKYWAPTITSDDIMQAVEATPVQNVSY